MNKALIAPIAAIVVVLAKELLGVDLEPQAVETTLTTILLLVSGIGIFMKPKKDGGAE